jgi:hypothetical protein
MQAGVEGLLRDETRPSRKPPLDRTVIARVIDLSASPPPGETTHWTAGAMAKAVGISVSSVQRVWRAHGLKPHQAREFKLSNDPNSRTLSASMLIRVMPSFSRLTRRARFRPSTARSRACQ